jgi:hypothetical protein
VFGWTAAPRCAYGESVRLAPARRILCAVLVLLSACAGVDAHVEAGPVDTHVQANALSGCITQRCSDEYNTGAYEACADQCRKRYGR